MKRKLLMILLFLTAALCLSFALVGCDSGKNSGNTADTDTEQGAPQTPDEDDKDPDVDEDKDPDGGNKDDKDPDVHDDKDPDVGGDKDPDESDEQKWTEGLEFQEVEDENGELVAVVTGLGDATDTDLVIPSTYHGLKVTTIGEGAFAPMLYEAPWDIREKEMNITSVVIPDSVTSIEDGAFYRCPHLSSVTLGKGVASIGIEAFDAPPKLVEIWNYSDLDIVPGDIDGNGGISYYAKQVYTTNEPSKQTMTDDGYVFYEDENGSYLLDYRGNETRLTLPAKSPNGRNYAIDQYAFSGLTSLRNVVIPDGVTSIGYQSFGCCLELTSITIGKTVTEIDDHAFDFCCKLTEAWDYSGVASPKLLQVYYQIYPQRHAPYVYTTDVESKQTTTSDGYIFFEDGDESYLIGYCGKEKDLTLPEKSPSGKNYAIDAIAFYCGGYLGSQMMGSIENVPLINPDRLHSIKIPDSVTSIGSYAFDGCKKLTKVTIGNSVTSIGRNAFLGCSGLTSINIPNSVTSIGEAVFAGSSVLMDIQFDGTVEEWQEIEKSSYWNANMWNYVITCTNGTIDKSGKVTYFEE